MNRMQQLVMEFHKKFGHTNNNKPTLTNKELNKFRENLLDEEIQELKDAINAGDLVEIADALGDALYVIFGTCCSHGIDIEPIFEEVHRSNMSKSSSGSNCIKQKKGKNYFKPNIKLVLNKQLMKCKNCKSNNLIPDHACLYIDAVDLDHRPYYCYDCCNSSIKRAGIKSPIYCEHTNQMPANCPCLNDCYCKNHSCKQIG